MATSDLQLAFKEDKRASEDMEKASEVWDGRLAQLWLCAAEYVSKSGTVRMVGNGDTGIQGRVLCASGSGDRRPSVRRAQGAVPRSAQIRLHGAHPGGSTTQTIRTGILGTGDAPEAAI